MKKDYAVYTDDAMVEGRYDNDLMDWFSDYETAEAFAQEMAQESGKEVYLSEVYDGDFSDSPEVF